MHLNQPRIAPIDPDRASEAQQQLLEGLAARGRPPLNIFLTMAREPDAAQAFLAWGGYVLSERNDLSPRLRELAILRTGYNCGSGYEFAQHTRVGLGAGLSEGEIAAVKRPVADGEWTALEAALLTACDELHTRQFVRDASWAALAELGDKARMDLVFTVGQYTQVSMLLNSFGVQLEDPAALDPDLDHR